MPREKLDIFGCAAESPTRTGTVRVGGLMGFSEPVAEMGGDPQREYPKFCVRDFCEGGFAFWHIEREAIAAR